MENREFEDRSDRGDRGDRSHDVRQKAIEAYDGARDRVAQAGKRTSDGIDEAPLIALGAGLAVGALVAALLPKTRTEADLLRPVSTKLRDNARTAYDSAKQAGSERLRELGLTPDAGKDAVRKVVEGVGDAAKTSAKAGVGAVRGEQ